MTDTNLNAPYSGALFATRDNRLLSGPFHIPSGDRVRVVAELSPEGEGQHQLRIHRVLKDKSLSKKPVATGYFARTRRFDATATETPRVPVGAGKLMSKDKVVPIVLFFNRTDSGESYYRIVPQSSQVPTDVPMI